MPPVKLIAVVAACLVLPAAGLPSTHDLLQVSRSAASDLEIVGTGTHNPPGTVRYISYQNLLTLPQVTVVVTGDENFRELPQKKLSVTGVYLDVLASALTLAPASDLVAAWCSDGYCANYTREYIQRHRPILALKIDGLPVDAWAAQTHNENPGTYFITHENFIPSFSVLAYKEMSKVPTNVIRLNFGYSQQAFGAITPHTQAANDPQIADGFRIAQQHCYRCHNMGSYGGTKAGKSWQTLGNLAASSPSTFERYVRNPKSIDPKASMSPNPEFDEATAKALQAYFQTFAAKASR